MIDPTSFSLLISFGVGACAITPIILILLLVRDLKEKSIW